MTLSMVVEHLSMVVFAIVIAILIGVPLGLLCYLSRAARGVVLRVVDLIQTTPALALLGIIMVFMGAGKPTVIVGLALYSLLPILSIFNTIPSIVFIGLLFLAWGTHAATVLAALGIYATFPVLKNTYAGLVSVDPQYLEAARGCGMSPWQSLLRVELPLALPTIIGGLRMSTVYTVSWAVLASMIGLGGLGDFIYAGLSSNDNALILLGAIPAALLAFALGTLVDLLQRRTVPKGLRKGGSAT